MLLFSFRCSLLKIILRLSFTIIVFTYRRPAHSFEGPENPADLCPGGVSSTLKDSAA